MDVNEALKRAREARLRFNNGSQDKDDLCDAAEDLVQAFGDLDTWLVRGGFLPKDWERKP